MRQPLCLLLLLLPFLGFAQSPSRIDPSTVTIVRDSFGVPHIFAPTDAAAAYGLAWAECEDLFPTLQEPLLAIHGRLASVKGKEGALLDICASLFEVRRSVEARAQQDISPEFHAILTAFVQGVNDYAAAHPEEVLRKDIFPATPEDVLMGYSLITGLMSNVPYELLRIFKNKEEVLNRQPLPGGSNGFALSPRITADHKTYLVSNSHQPLEGFAAWYEAHVHSDEGWDVHGATFPGGVTPFVGAGPHFGWTHTTNFDDFVDMYRLTVQKKGGLHYRMDGQWLPLEKNRVKLRVKVGPLIIPVGKTFYRSQHGPVLKNKHGYFALRFAAMFRVGAAEQWYRMNKATDKESFLRAVHMQQTPNQNIIFADQEGSIFFMGYANFPQRDPSFHWRGILPGDTSAAVWQDTFYPLDSVPAVFDPKCGWVFNSNNSSLYCTTPSENPQPEDFSPTMGLQPKHTARSIRVGELMDGKARMTYEDLKVLKYDSKLPIPLYTRTIENLDLIRHLDAQKYPDIADAIQALHEWDGSVTADNTTAPIFSVALQHLIPVLRDGGIPDLNNSFAEADFVEAVRFAKRHLLKHFGSIHVPMGEVQRHVRGDVSLPLWGVPEAITQMYTDPWKKGRFKGVSGESFILFATYGDNGLEKLETVNCFGSSNRPDSPHYTDQMEMFVNKQLKPVALDRETLTRQAERVYHPGQ